MFKILEGVDQWMVFSMKLATISFVLIVLKIWGGAMRWVVDTNVWWFVLAFVIFALRAGMGTECCRRKITKVKVVKKKIARRKSKR
ncbi:MAG: hypothetical protein V1889_03860 [archaeon]